MNIIELARQAGVRDDEHRFEFSEYKYLERFADLVAAQEREACAKVCDKMNSMSDYYALRVELICANAIRARGNT